MTSLALVSNLRAPPREPSARREHDIRNLLAVAGLHLDKLARLSGPHGADAVDATHILLSKIGQMCNRSDGDRSRRQPFDVAGALRQVVDLAAPLGPDGFAIDLPYAGPRFVLGDPEELFRVFFNLIYNAVTVARATSCLRLVSISVTSTGKITAVTIADNGPGLPPHIRERLFRGPACGDALNGHGLAIARELTERNGGTLRCETSPSGTVFRLELATHTSIGMVEGPVTRSLGHRVLR